MFHFSKYTAFGNVYIVIDPNCNRSLSFSSNLTSKDLKKIQNICNIYFGIGSDGIIFGPIFDKEKIQKSLKLFNINYVSELDECFFCRIFNPDGSEAEKSGNGTRIFAQYLIDKNYIKRKSFNILTVGGKVGIKLINKNKKIIESNIGIANFDTVKIGINSNKKEFLQEEYIFRLNDIPKDRLSNLLSVHINNSIKDIKFKINCVSMGNPHCVVICDTISPAICKEFGPLIENNQIFLNKINVQFAKIIDRNNIQIFIWERGAGYTLCSGTSTAAVASVCYKLNLCDKKVLIKTEGGDVALNIEDNDNLRKNFSVSIVGGTILIAEGISFNY